MKVISKQSGGYRSGGGVLLKKGENVLVEPLTRREREFIDVMVKARVATIVEESTPEAPISETKIGAAEPAQEEAARPAMRVRKAKKATR